MHLVKRTKSPPPGNEPKGVPAVHWATQVAPAGNVTGWTDDRAKARELGAGEAEAVRAFYASRPQAGKIEIVPVRPEPQPGLKELKRRERKGEPAETRTASEAGE